MEPSHVLAAMGVDRALGGGRAAAHARAHDDRRRRRRTRSTTIVVGRRARCAGGWRPVAVKVMVAMSGGVDSSVAAALLARDGHDVVGVTMRLWGGESDTGCCSVADVDDARRVAQQLGIDHLVFNFTDDFDAHVVDPYVAAHADGDHAEPVHRVQPQRQVRPARRARRRARLRRRRHRPPRPHRQPATGAARCERGADRAKDQSYVVHMLDQADARPTLFPVGAFADEGRAARRRRRARAAHGRQARQPGRVLHHVDRRPRRLPRRRIPFHPATRRRHRRRPRRRASPAVELVTVGQRRGLGLPGGGPKRFVRRRRPRPRRRSSSATRRTCSTPSSTVVTMSWVDDAGRRRRARAVQRPRRAAPGDRRARRRTGAVVRVGRRPAPGRAGPERRALRPHRHVRARRRHRQPDGPAAAQSTGRPRAGGVAQHGAGSGRRDEQRREVDRRARAAIAAAGADVAVIISSSTIPTARPGVGPVRSSAPSAAAPRRRGRSRATRAARHHHRLGEHDRVVDDEAGRHEHEPAPRSWCQRPGAGTTPPMATDAGGHGDEPRAARPRERGGDDRGDPDEPRQHARRRGSRAAGAAGSAARRRTPTPARRAARSRPPPTSTAATSAGASRPATLPTGARPDAAATATTTPPGHDDASGGQASATPGTARASAPHARPDPRADRARRAARRRLRSATASPTARSADDGDGEPRQRGPPTASRDPVDARGAGGAGCSVGHGAEIGRRALQRETCHASP